MKEGYHDEGYHDALYFGYCKCYLSILLVAVDVQGHVGCLFAVDRKKQEVGKRRAS